MYRALAFLVVLTAEVSAQTAWLDVNGEPLPFQDEEAILEFLRTAPVVNRTDIGAGVNRSEKLTLEQDGVRAHAIFRVVDIRRENQPVGDRYYWQFADSYLFESAAYELAKMLGVEAIPPAALRTIRRQKGSIQIWVEDVLDEEGEDFEPPNPSGWAEQVWTMHLFDNLVFNVDRNRGNMLVDSSYHLWLIDHTRAFQSVRDLLNDRVTRVDRAVFDRLVALTEEEIQTAMRPFLNGREMGALLRRRELLIEHVNALVAERGEDVVFY